MESWGRSPLGGASKQAGWEAERAWQLFRRLVPRAGGQEAPGQEARASPCWPARALGRRADLSVGSHPGLTQAQGHVLLSCLSRFRVAPPSLLERLSKSQPCRPHYIE